MAYRAFDLMEAGPQRIAQMLAELVELFKTEALHRLPVKSWDVRHAQGIWFSKTRRAMSAKWC